MGSPFLTPGTTTTADSLAVLHLRRNLLTPTILRSHDDENLGYEEGKVTNTRFGSFPHSTLIGKPWGSQVLASNVDTGSRGQKRRSRKDPHSLKRKADEIESSEATDQKKPSLKTAVTAASGFLHIFPPTPESWTASLPHRTQVVYTPDYSYILHRLRARPGTTIIEAGAGSGSFTHASARAVFNGYPSDSSKQNRIRHGKVCSFEFHEQRVGRIREEIRDHGLDGIVRVNHRDVYKDGFLLGEPWDGESPKANAVFLDLPAPWLALKHLVREPTDGSQSPLDPSTPVHLCSFSPCLEQAQQTISILRQLSWIGISMVEIAYKQIEVRRQRYGAESDVSKGAIPGPMNVDDAVNRLRVYEDRAKIFRESQLQTEPNSSTSATPKEEDMNDETGDANTPTTIPIQETESKKYTIPLHRQGTIIHRSEPELKTHTSYLIFATLPRSWTEEDEQRCRERWPSQGKATGANESARKSKKQLKREAKVEREALKSNGRSGAGEKS